MAAAAGRTLKIWRDLMRKPGVMEKGESDDETLLVCQEILRKQEVMDEDDWTSALGEEDEWATSEEEDELLETPQTVKPINPTDSSSAPLSYDPCKKYIYVGLSGYGRNDWYVVDCDPKFGVIGKLSTYFPMLTDNLPLNFGCAFVDSKIYIIGGEEKKERSLLNSVEIFDTKTQKWFSGPAMHQARTHTLVIVSKRKIYVFGGGTDHPFAEFYNVDEPNPAWSPLDTTLPPNLTRFGTFKFALEHAVLDDGRILFWNTYCFYLFDPEKNTWTVYSTPSDIFPPGAVVRDNVAVVGSVLYFFYGESLFAYDVYQNKSFSDSLLTIEYEACGRKLPRPSQNAVHLFAAATATNKHELFLIWHHSYAPGSRHSRIACVKVHIETSTSNQQETSLEVVNHCFEYFHFPSDSVLQHILVAQNDDDGVAQSDTETPLLPVQPYDDCHFLQKLFFTMHHQLVTFNAKKDMYLAQCTKKRFKEMDFVYSHLCPVSVLPAGRVKYAPLQENQKSKEGFLRFLAVEKHLEKYLDKLEDVEFVEMEIIDLQLKDLAIPMGARKKIICGFEAYLHAWLCQN